VSFLKKVEAAGDGVQHLMQVLYRTVGNKRYLHDLEVLLKKLELTGHDEQTLHFLARDLDK
jgi:hypothetical protein